jgi:hypothetical protein
MGGECKVGGNCITTIPMEDEKAPPILIISVNGNNDITLKATPMLRFIETFPIDKDDKSSITITRGGNGVKITAEGKAEPFRSSDLRQLPEIKITRGYDLDYFILIKNGKISSCTLRDCTAIASSRNAGNRGDAVHVAAARLDGQQAWRDASRKHNIQFTGYEALNVQIENVQEDLKDAQIISISGHHYEGKTEIWGEGGEIALEDLPPSNKVTAVTFSACNTIKDLNKPEHVNDPVLPTLIERYPKLNVVLGYNTKAPLEDGKVWKELVPILQQSIETGNYEPLKRYVVREGIVDYGKTGPQQLGIYIRENNKWTFCKPGGCHELNIRPPASVGPIAANI